MSRAILKRAGIVSAGLTETAGSEAAEKNDEMKALARNLESASTETAAAWERRREAVRVCRGSDGRLKKNLEAVVFIASSDTALAGRLPQEGTFEQWAEYVYIEELEKALSGTNKLGDMLAPVVRHAVETHAGEKKSLAKTSSGWEAASEQKKMATLELDVATTQAEVLVRKFGPASAVQSIDKRAPYGSKPKKKKNEGASPKVAANGAQVEEGAAVVAAAALTVVKQSA